MTTSELNVRLQREFNVPVEQAFRAWRDPELLTGLAPPPNCSREQPTPFVV